MKAYEDLIARGRADPTVVGLVLSGSQARVGMPTDHSDWDVFVVVNEKGGSWTKTIHGRELDEIVCTVDELADTSDIWGRYAFRGARVLLDRLDGRVAELVRRQAEPSAEEAREWARYNLDAYLNQTYRAAKNRRDGRESLARLEDAESVAWFLGTLFPLYGRLRPYNKYLDWELRTYPLGDPWQPDTLARRLVAHVAGLWVDLEPIARDRGHGAIIDDWGDELELIRAAATRRP